MKQKEINSSGFNDLLAVVRYIKDNADINPKRNSDGYMFDSGKQHAYSDVWYRLNRVTKEMIHTREGYINWKVMNLMIGFIIGGILFLWILT